MYLKSLTLKGFKSFADPTTLNFEPGVSVIVGPNGSGKSNIVDAISWVLGAQGAKGLRGSRMEDVIFAGAKGKPALGRAEVSIVLDNSQDLGDGSAAGDRGALASAGAEIRITRTLFRSGESGYSINGASCRLWDIQELLSDAGVGRTQHVIIGQGRLDAVLEARPEERRAAIEEAAGILKHRRRRERAQRRLESADEDARSLDGHCEEIRRQCRPLRRQAEAAARRGDLETQIAELRMRLAGSKLASLEGDLKAAEERITAASAAEEQLAKELEALEERLEAEEYSQEDASSSFELSDLHGRATAASSAAQSLQRIISERLRTAEAAAAASAPGDPEPLRAEHQALSKELAVAEESLADYGRRLEGLAAAGTQLALGAEEISREQHAIASEREAVNSAVRLAELRDALSEAKAAVVAAERSVAQVDSERQNLKRRQQAASERVTQAERHLASATAAEAVGASSLVGAESRLEFARSAKEAAEKEAVEASEKATAAQAGLSGAAARVEALELAMKELWDSSGTSALEGLDGVLGPLAELVAVGEGWEQAFMAAAGSFLAAVVTRDPASARAAVGRLREVARPGTVVPLGEAKAGSPDRQDSLAMHLSATDPDVERLLWALVGDVVVTEGGWEEALATHLNLGVTVVSREGDCFGPDAWKIGPASQGVTAGTLEAARLRVEDLAEAESRALGESAVSAERARLARSELAVAERERAAAAQAQLRLEAELSSARAGCEAAQVSLAEATAAWSSAEERFQSQLSEMRESKATLGAAQQAYDAAEDQQRSSEDILRQREEALGEARASHGERQAAHEKLRREIEVAMAAAVERQRFVTQRLERLGIQIEEVQGLVARHRLAAEEAGRRAKVLDLLHSEAAGALGRVSEAAARAGELMEQRRKGADARRENLTALRAQRSGAIRSLEAAREFTVSCRLSASEAKVRLDEASSGVRRELGKEPSEALRLAFPPEEAEEAAEELARLDKKLKALGPVNPLAAAELAEAEEKLGFIGAQLADAQQARRELVEVLEEIDGEIDRLFSAAFQDVSRHFSELVSAVFPGGHGSLSLGGSPEQREVGVELAASPAGKSVRRLSLLSGGERSLVALAFEFALFRSRPSPFYVMDEVEAALDDTNLSRFLSLVRELRFDSQLLIVSHQKRTMEAGDCLYGVTMERAGATKVISQRLQRESAQLL